MAMFAVTTARGPAWLSGHGIREQPQWDRHAAFMDRLVERGQVILGGPIEGETDETALLAVEAESPQAIQRIFAEDPWTTSGVLRVKRIRAWTIWLDAR